MASHVADFEPQPAAPSQTHYHQGHPMHNAPQLSGYPQQYLPPPPQPSHPLVKSEPIDNRYLSNMPQYLPPLPGPQLNGAPRLSGPALPTPNGQPGAYTPRPPMPMSGAPRLPPYPPQPIPQSQPGPSRIPQVDGPSSSSSESPSPGPTNGSRTANQHTTPQAGDTEEINSDLDDSDTDGEDDDQEGIVGEGDIVFCTYDKVLPRMTTTTFRTTDSTIPGCTCEEQMEMHSQGWRNSYE